MATQLSKSQVIEKIATTTELAKRDVKNVMDSLVDVGHKELKKSGIFPIVQGIRSLALQHRLTVTGTLADVRLEPQLARLRVLPPGLKQVPQWRLHRFQP